MSLALVGCRWKGLLVEFVVDPVEIDGGHRNISNTVR
jgi:hypothetical protein